MSAAPVSTAPRRRRRLAPVLLAVAVLVGLTACGSSGSGDKASADLPSAKEIFAKAKTESLKAESFTLDGFVTQSGEKMVIQLSGAADGSNTKMVVETPSQGRAEILVVGAKAFVKGDKKFWATNGAPNAPAELISKYVAAPKSQMGDSFPTGRGLLEQTFSASGLTALQNLATKVESTTFEGAEAYRAADRVQSEGSGELIVDAESGLPLKLASTGGDASELVFSEWDAVKAFAAPKGDQIFTP